MAASHAKSEVVLIGLVIRQPVCMQCVHHHSLFPSCVATAQSESFSSQATFEND
jgi:hypothetical protein